MTEEVKNEESNSCHILIVDDDEAIRIMLEVLLKHKGFSTLTAPNAKEAMEEIEHGSVNILLTDIRMPEMDGMTLTAWARREHPDIDIIIMTAFASLETAAEAVRLGVFDYLIKPFPDANLVAMTIEKAVKNQRMKAELKKTTKELRRIEQLYHLITENVSDTIWTMDMSLKNTFISASVERMRGYTAEEVMSQDLEATLTPPSLELAMRILEEELARELMEQKDIYRFKSLDLELKCKDGSTIWTEAKMTFLRDVEEQPIGILGVTRDISERRKAEEARRENEAKLRSIILLISDLAFTTDKDGVFEEYYQPNEKINLNAPFKEFIGKPFNEVLPSSFVEPLETAIEKLRATDRAQHIEYSTNVDNKKACYSVGISMRKNDLGEFDGIIAVVRDVTERKHEGESRE